MNPLDNFRVVLVGTLYSGNVGSCCRAMANMGMTRLRLAAPRIQDPDFKEGEQLAVHAVDVLRSREEYATFAEAVADCAAVVGTTARGGLYRQHVRTPRETAGELLEIASSAPVALVFGREDKGLLNEEVMQCTHLVRIPVAESYTSINLSQAVMVMAYEIFSAAGTYTPPREKAPLAPQAQKDTMFAHWRDMLRLIGFMEDKQTDHMMQGVHRIFSRGVRTKDDAAIMLGVARQATWAANAAGRRPPEEG